MHILFLYILSSNNLDGQTFQAGRHDRDDTSVTIRHWANDNTGGGTLCL